MANIDTREAIVRKLAGEYCAVCGASLESITAAQVVTIAGRKPTCRCGRVHAVWRVACPSCQVSLEFDRHGESTHPQFKNVWLRRV